MKTIALLKHGCARDVNERLSGFGEIQATEDARVLITALISSAHLTGECAQTFDPWFALALAGGLTEAAHEALRQRERQTAEALVTAGLAAQEAQVALDRVTAARIADATEGADRG